MAVTSALFAQKRTTEKSRNFPTLEKNVKEKMTKMGIHPKSSLKKQLKHPAGINFWKTACRGNTLKFRRKSHVRKRAQLKNKTG